MKHYYTKESQHGNSSSYGFSNDTIVSVFNSKQSRDNYVSESGNLSCEAIKRSEVTGYARNWDLTNNFYVEPQKFTDQHWVIDTYNSDDSIGKIGEIAISNNCWSGNQEPFYK